ncbi:class I SAM-dependent methyltransferase [Capnocytophaga sp. ARDL2]|uniref:class I SAM-dependent methyltransferase n=1 Tax=Capnocytophaga sp. ARDL2 TaxID=3238809 RepID=UPI003556217E
MKDLFGKAIFNFYTQNDLTPIITETNFTEADEMDVSYLFRSYKDMPKIEQLALTLCKGKILDIGCGAGSHSLYLQEKGMNVTAIDVSPKAIETCQLRGIKNTQTIDILQLNNQKFDTILLLMNGTGIFKNIKSVAFYLNHLKSLLNDNGQILIDSSDLIYLFDEDEDGGKWIPNDRDYYGETTFFISYKGENEAPFDWLYLDYNTLQNACHFNGLQCELLHEGEHFDYLARIYK